MESRIAPVGSSIEQRMVWMDTLRGAAILFVVLFHAAHVLRLAGLDIPVWIDAFNSFFGPFRMPMLMMLSGMLLARSLNKSTGIYLWGKLRLIAWPALVWTAIFGVTIGIKYEWWNPLFWVNSTYLWYLQALLVYYLLALIVRRVPPWVLVLVPLCLSFFTHDSFGLHRLLFLMAFFFFGHAISAYRATFDKMIRSRWTWLLAIPPLLLAVASAISEDPDGLRYVAPLWPVVAAGGIVSVKVATKFGRGIGVVGLQYVGRNSLIFYVVHRPLLVWLILPLHTWWNLPIPIHFAISVAIALLACWGMVELAKRTPAKWLFEIPAFRRRKLKEESLAAS